jgi:hypothetical protein
MALTRADFVARAMQRFVHAEGDRATSLRATFEKKWASWGMRPIRDESDDAPAICQNTPTRREQRRAASDRVLRKK